MKLKNNEILFVMLSAAFHHLEFPYNFIFPNNSLISNLKYILFFYKNNFMITKALVWVKKLRTNKEQNQACCPAERKNKVSRLAISNMVRTQNQNRACLSLILYFMYTSSTLTL